MMTLVVHIDVDRTALLQFDSPPQPRCGCFGCGQKGHHKSDCWHWLTHRRWRELRALRRCEATRNVTQQQHRGEAAGS